MPTGWSLLLLGSLALAAPPLSDAQQQQLATAADHSPVFEEAALYALLTHVATWPAADDDRGTAGAMSLRDVLPLDEPANHRGELFVIEGRLAAIPRPFGTLSRLGPWDQRLRQWPILVEGVDASSQSEAVVLVYLLDNPAPADLPAVGTHVRAIARFYKLWTSPDLEGRERNYLTFVGRRAQWQPHAALGVGRLMTPLLIAVTLLLTAYIVLRQWLRHRGARHAADRPPATMPALAEYDSPSANLPRDPAEALARMAGEPDTSRRTLPRQTENTTDARR